MKLRCCRHVSLALWITGLLLSGCQTASDMQTEEGKVPQRPIEAVLAAHTPELMAMTGVVGTYMGALDDGTLVIKVMVVEATAELRQRIPEQLEGYPVIIEATGEIRPLENGD